MRTSRRRGQAGNRAIAAALKELDAKIYTEPIPEGSPSMFPAMLARARMWHLGTQAGRLDIAFEPAGVEGYDDLKKDPSVSRRSVSSFSWRRSTISSGRRRQPVDRKTWTTSRYYGR